MFSGSLSVSEIRLTLPLPPNRANAREHWRTTHRKKTAYYERADLAIEVQVPRSFRWVQERRTLTTTLYVWAKMDKGNAVARLKWLEDSLVRNGLLVDDSEEWLDLRLPKQVIDRKNMRVELALVTPGEES